MKASELKEHLEKAMSENGDLELRFVSDETDTTFGNSKGLAGFVTIMKDDDTPNYFLLCCNNGLESFSG